MTREEYWKYSGKTRICRVEESTPELMSPNELSVPGIATLEIPVSRERLERPGFPNVPLWRYYCLYMGNEYSIYMPYGLYDYELERTAIKQLTDSITKSIHDSLDLTIIKTEGET